MLDNPAIAGDHHNAGRAAAVPRSEPLSRKWQSADLLRFRQYARLKIGPIAIEPHTPVAYQVPALVLPVVVPQFISCMSINGKNVVRDGEVQNALHHERHAFDALQLAWN